MAAPSQADILIQRRGLKMSRYIKKKVILVNSSAISVNIETRYSGYCLVNISANLSYARA